MLWLRRGWLVEDKVAPCPWLLAAAMWVPLVGSLLLVEGPVGVYLEEASRL